MEHIVERKMDETRWRWETAIKDKNFDCIRNLPVAETRPEHFDKALADGKVTSNVYLRRIHNHALGMEWLLKSVIPRLQAQGGTLCQGGSYEQFAGEQSRMMAAVMARIALSIVWLVCACQGCPQQRRALRAGFFVLAAPPLTVLAEPGVLLLGFRAGTWWPEAENLFGSNVKTQK